MPTGFLKLPISHSNDLFGFNDRRKEIEIIAIHDGDHLGLSENIGYPMLLYHHYHHYHLYHHHYLKTGFKNHHHYHHVPDSFRFLRVYLTFRAIQHPKGFDRWFHGFNWSRSDPRRLTMPHEKSQPF